MFFYGLGQFASAGQEQYLKICFILRSNLNFALGGVNAINFKKLKNKHLYGFGAISYFKE